MQGHRFEVGEWVTAIERRFPNAVQRTELIVVERLPGSGDPQYRLAGRDRTGERVLGESALSPPACADGIGRRLGAPTAEGAGSPWAA
jgi:hypothetical protein